eukprot:RCo051642
MFGVWTGWGAPADVEYEGICSRMVGAICGMCVGLVLLVGALVLLGWNEGRAVHTARALEAGMKTFVNVPCTPISPALEGRLVHLTCDVGNMQNLTDPAFQVAIKAIQMDRSVEMFQYKESTTSHSDGKVVYTYSTVWSSHSINSKSFKFPNQCIVPGTSFTQDCTNPPFPDMGKNSMTSVNVTAGDFLIPPKLFDESIASRGLSFQPVWPIPLTWPFSYVSPTANRNVMLNQTQRQGDWLWTSLNPAYPVVGDLRLKWKASSPTMVSILAEQAGRILQPWQSSGDSIFLLREGAVSAMEMLGDAEGRNEVATWAIRVGGFLMCWFGLHLIVAPLAVAPNLIPFFGSLLSDLVGCVLCYLTCASGLALSALVIGIAWVAYRPVIGIPVLAVTAGTLCGVCILGAIRRQRMRAAREAVVGGGMAFAPSPSPRYPMMPMPPTPPFEPTPYPLSVSPEYRPPKDPCCPQFGMV